MKFNLTEEREKWATIAWQSAVDAKESTAETLRDYLTSILQPIVDNLLIDITDSWKPEDPVETKLRREEVIAQLKELPADRLEIVEAALQASKEP